MTVSAKEVRARSGERTKAAGLYALYQVVEKRPVAWSRVCAGGVRVYSVTGYDRRRDLVHFSSWWKTEGGGAVGHSRVGLPLLDALSNETGDLSNAQILI